MQAFSELLQSAKNCLPAVYHDRVVVFGSAPMVMAGLKERTDDLDLFVSSKTFDELVKSGLRRNEQAKPEFIELAPNVSIYREWFGLDFWDVYSDAAPLASSEGFKVASLHHVLEFKVKRNAPKDATDIEELAACLPRSRGPFWSRGCVKEQIDVWYKYEQTAMHFNDLLLKLRTQAIGGVAVLATITTLFNEKIPAEVRPPIVRGIFVCLALVLLGIALVDQFYYQNLLTGSVKEIREFEASTSGGIRLSTAVEGMFKPWTRFRLGPIAFYVFILLALGFAIWKIPQATAVSAAAQDSVGLETREPQPGRPANGPISPDGAVNR